MITTRIHYDRGYITLVTGSKFFEGPPFSGAVVIPIAISEEIESHIQSCKVSRRAHKQTHTHILTE